jgi:flagellar hook-associated protein 3 FlgL
MKPIPSFLVATLARTDLGRISAEMYDLQRQTASGAKADDLKGYGAGASRVVSARSAIVQADARVETAKRLAARLDIQDIALGQAADAAATLKQDIMTALAANDGRYLADNLANAYRLATDALNTQYEGISLFSGERRSGNVIVATGIEDLPGLVRTGALYDESERVPSLDLGVGGAVPVSEKASDFSRELYDSFAALFSFTRTEPLTDPMTADQRARLLGIVENLDLAHRDIVAAQGRNGDTQARVEAASERLVAQADLLAKHVGDVADADLAEVAMKLSAAQTQYQAAAKVFAQIKDMSLVNFLD